MGWFRQQLDKSRRVYYKEDKQDLYKRTHCPFGVKVKDVDFMLENIPHGNDIVVVGRDYCVACKYYIKKINSKKYVVCRRRIK